MHKSDTSKQTFFSVAYFRFCYTSGAVKCAFATAKTWVAPKKPLSMPKLELQAAILSACKVIVFSNQGRWLYHWQHLTPISWLKNTLSFSGFTECPNVTPPLSQNWISEILNLPEPCQGLLNPVYDVTKGLPVTYIWQLLAKWSCFLAPAWRITKERDTSRQNSEISIPQYTLERKDRNRSGGTWLSILGTQ